MKIAVIGLGQFGHQFALALVEERHEVLVIDNNEQAVDTLKDLSAHAVIADATDARALQELGLNEFDRVCIMIGEDFAASLIIAAHLQEIGVKQLYVRSINDVHKRLLRLMKVDQIVEAEELAARQLAKRMGIRGATRHFGLSDTFGIVELHVPAFLVGRSLLESDLRQRFGVNLITLRRASRKKDEVIGIPPPDLLFQENDELVVFGTEKAIKEFSNQKSF